MKEAGKGVTREGAREEMTRGMNLTAVYPALFYRKPPQTSRLNLPKKKMFTGNIGKIL